jgi:ParB family chromosome partitioning protein
MASKDTRQAHGALGKTDMLLFDPERIKVVNDPAHALYDDRANEEPTEAFVENLMLFGVIEPVIFRKDGETGEPIIEDGRKRTLGLREANRRLAAKGVPEADLWRLPAIPKRGSDGDAVLRMIMLNEQRFEDTASNRARKASAALDRGKTEEEVACALGVSLATLKNMLKFIDAPAVVRHAADAKKITMTQAYKLATLPVEEAKEKVAQLIAEAPRQPGKKRATKAAAERARAIVDGPQEVKVPVETSTAKADNVFGRRSDQEIDEASLEIATSSLFSDETVRVVAAFTRWLLGEDGALVELSKLRQETTANAAE